MAGWSNYPGPMEYPQNPAQGVEIYNGPHNEEQPIIDMHETTMDALYFEPEYNDDDDIEGEAF